MADCAFSRVPSALLAIMIIMFKTLRRPVIPSNFHNLGRRNRRWSHTTRCRYDGRGV